jgi:serine/threonine protein kinase
MRNEGSSMSSSLLTPGSTFPTPYGRYVLLDKIGEGGMAEVFRAAVLGPAGFQRILVIKRILSSISQDQSFVSMFIDEANLCARLSHPNIVQIYDFGRVMDTYFIAMEHVMGRNVSSMMSKVVRSHRLLPPVIAADIARQVCLGLDYAHTLRIGDRPLGIVHRDVSPTNIMVAYTGAVKVLDFGIARAAEGRETSTRSGMLKGKIAYLAPEQIHFGPLDCRVDIFATGIVLYEMLAGRRLFRAHNDLQMMKMIMEMSIPPLVTQNPEVKPELECIVMRALERDPDSRYQSASEMASDLEGYLLDERHSAKAVSHFLSDLFCDEISCTPTVEISTDRLIEMVRAVTHKGYQAGDPAGASGAPRGSAKAVVVDDLTAVPSEGPQSESRFVNSTVAIRSQMDPVSGSAFFGPQTPSESRAAFFRSSEVEDSARDIVRGEDPTRIPEVAGSAEGSSQYLDLSITKGLQPKHESCVTVGSLLRDRRSLRDGRLGRIVLAAGLATASVAILLAAIHHTNSRHEAMRPRTQTGLLIGESEQADPRGFLTPGSQAPASIADPRGSSTQVADSRGSSTQVADPRGSRTQVADSRVADPRVADPRVADPRVADPRVADPRVADLRQVQILLDSVPQDATILRAGKVVGTTPAAVYLPQGADIVELSVVRIGYVTSSIKILPDFDKPVLVTLKPSRTISRESSRPTPGAKTPRSRASSTSRSTIPREELPPHPGENIRRAIPVDPFSK